MKDRELPLMLDDTQRAFDCCTSHPINCERCPLFEDYRLCNKPMLVSWDCRKQLIYCIRYWLRQAVEED